METYLELIPIELLEIITYYILPDGINNFLVSFGPRTRDSLLQVEEKWYHDTFKQEFPYYYDSFYNLLKYDHIHIWEDIYDCNHTWKDMYTDMNKSIPRNITGNMYTDMNKSISRNITGNILRSSLRKDNMLDTIKIVSYPQILYEALFYNTYKDMYVKLSDYLENLSNGKAWYYLYAMFNDAYDVGRWGDLTMYDFYTPLLSRFSAVSSNDKIFEILSSDEVFYDLLLGQYVEGVDDVLILPIDDKNYTTSTKLFKWFVNKIYSDESGYLIDYVSKYIQLDNEEMVRWLMYIYINIDINERELDKYMLRVSEEAPEKYQKIIASYLTDD